MRFWLLSVARTLFLRYLRKCSGQQRESQAQAESQAPLTKWNGMGVILVSVANEKLEQSPSLFASLPNFVDPVSVPVEP